MKQKQCTALCCTIPVDIVILRTNFNVMKKDVTHTVPTGEKQNRPYWVSEYCTAGISDRLALLLSGVSSIQLRVFPDRYCSTPPFPLSAIFCSVCLLAVFPFTSLSSWMPPLPFFPVSSFSQHIKKTLDHILTLGEVFCFLPLPTNRISFLLSRLTFIVTCASRLLVPLFRGLYGIQEP